jgi:acetyl esterase/lipase
MKLFLLMMLVSTMVYAQTEIPLYTGPIPNSKKPINPIDTSVTKSGSIDILHGVVRPTLTVYQPERSKATDRAVIVCPGGGYSILATSHEGSDIAKRLNEAGITAFVLKYRLPREETMTDKKIGPMQDAQRAIQLVRERAKDWGVDPRKIGILGSSAGGHLASTVGTHFNDVKIENPKGTSLRPDFMILNYPVISFSDALANAGSRKNLIGRSKNLTEKLADADIQYFSNELHVTKMTPPTFIITAIDDDVVLAGNTFGFIAALQQNEVPVESFIYEKGGHGFGMGNPTAKKQWIESCIDWIKKNF